MKRLVNNPFLLALATLVGTIVGAGIFGIPYVVAQAGIWVGLLHLIVLGVVVTLLHLMFGEIALRTKEKHRLIGYTAKYFSNPFAKILVTVSTVIGIVGSLLAYIIIAGDFLELIFGSFIPFSNFTFSLFFWAVLSFFILRGIQTIAKMELFFNVALFLVVGLIFAFAIPHVQTQNFSGGDFSNFFLPYGVVMFAYLGLSAIPETAELFKSTAGRKSLDNLIIWASVVSGILFLIFTLVVLGVSGEATTEDALIGLIPFLGERVVALGAMFGLIAIAASFLVLGNYLKNTFRYDYKMPFGISTTIAILAPMVLFLLGFRDFILVAGIVGAVATALEGTMVAIIFKIAKKKGNRMPEYNLHIPKVVLIGVVVLLLIGATFELLM